MLNWERTGAFTQSLSDADLGYGLCTELNTYNRLLKLDVSKFEYKHIKSMRMYPRVQHMDERWDGKIVFIYKLRVMKMYYERLVKR